MAKKFMRISLVALVLCAVLALTAFAYETDIFGRVNGLENGVKYTVAQYDFTNNAYGEYTELTADTQLTTGVWGIKADDAEPEVIFVPGTDSGYVNWYSNETGLIASGIFGGKVDGYVPGKWTVNKDGIFRDISNYKDQEIILYADKKTFQVKAQKTVVVEDAKYPVYAVGDAEYYLKDEAYYAVADNALYEGEDAPVAVEAANWIDSLPLMSDENKLQETVVSYGFTNVQVVPASKVNELKFDSVLPQAGGMISNQKADGTTYIRADVKGTFTWVVKTLDSAEEERYTINIDATQKVFTAPAAMAESEGYVVAIEYAPYAFCPNDIFTGHPSDGSQDCYSYINPKEGRNAVDFDVALPEAPVAYDGYGTIYVDAEYDIEIAPATISADGKELTFTEWSDYEYNIAAERNLVGLYAVRGKYNGMVTEPTFAYAYGDKADRAALGQLTEHNDGTSYPTRVSYKAGGGFVPGFWANTKWVTGSNASTHSTFGKWSIGTTGGQVTGTSTTNLKNAFAALAELKAAETPDEEAIAAAEAALLKAQTTVANQYSSANYTYAYEANEIINVKEANTYGYAWYQNNANVNFTTARVKLIAYVADRNGNVTPYSIVREHNYPSGATISGTFNFADFLPDEGWIVAIQVYPCSDIAPEEITRVASTGNGRMLLNVDPAERYSILDAPELPVLDEKPDELYFEKGVVKGFDADKLYAWAPFSLSGYDVNDWTNLPVGTTEYSFDREGAVAIKYASDGWSNNGSQPKYIAFDGSDDNIINTVTMSTTNKQQTVKVNGTSYNVFDIDGVEYYLNGDKYYAVADNSEYTGENAANAKKVFTKINVPEVVYLANNDDNRYNVKFNEGKWSGVALHNELAVSYSFDPLCLGSSHTPIPGSLATALKNAEAGTDGAALATARANAAKVSNAIYYSYAFKPEEIIKMSDFVSMDYRATYRQGGFVVSGYVQTKIVFKVIDENGDLVDRVAYKDATYTGSGSNATVYGYDFDDVSGHIVGIVFYPYVLTEGSYLKYKGSTANGDYNITLVADGYKVNRTLDTAEAPENIVFDGNKITGLDADATYYYGRYTIAGKLGEWQKVTGVTEITHDLTGLIGLSIEGDGIWTSESKPVIGYVEGDAAARTQLGNVTDGKPAYQTSQYWNPGVWTGDYLSWYDQVTGAYSFLDQSTGVNCSMVETLWLYSVTKEEALARLAADAAKGEWPNSYTTSNPERLKKVIETHYSASDYAETLAANKLAHQTMVANLVADRNIAYAFDETEILPVDEFISIDFTSKMRQGGFKFGSIKSKAVIHVMDENANVTAYEWWSDEWALNERGVWKKITVNVQSIENLPEEGWVVGIEFYPYADVEPSSIIAVPDTRVDADSIPYSFGQQHVCIGYYPGSYNILIDAPEISYDSETGVISGLDANTTYKYMKYSVSGAGTAIDVPAGATTITLTEDGLWGVVSVANGVISNPALALYHVDATTTAEIGTIVDEGTYKHYDIAKGDVWEQGKWSGKDIGVHSSFGGTYVVGSTGGHINGTSSKTLYAAVQSGVAADIEAAKADIIALGNNVKFRYAYADDEIVPVSELLRIAFKAVRRMGSLRLGNATAKVTFFVLDENGIINEYVWTSDRYNAHSGKEFSVLTNNIENWPEEGWVVGFQINPWTDLDPDGITTIDNGGYNTMVNVTFLPDQYTVLSGNIETVVPVIEITSGVTIKVANYNSLLTYVYSVDGKEWTEFAGNSFVPAKASTEYVVKSLASGPYVESEVSAPVTSRPVALAGTSLVLDGRIATRVYIDIDTEKVTPNSLVMYSTRVNADHKDAEIKRIHSNSNLNPGWLSGLKYDESKSLYYFEFSVAAKDADNVSFETQLDYTPIGGAKHTLGTIGSDLKVTSYIASAKALAAAGNAEFVAALPLVEALETYVSYAENYFGKGEDAAYVSTADVKAEAPVRTNAALEGVEFYGTSILLEDQVSIRHYFAVEDLAAFEAAYKVEGKYKVKGDYIYFDITDIPAQEIGTAQKFTITDDADAVVYEVSYSVANYIEAMMEDDDVNLVSLVNAMYDYYLAAEDYAK